MEFIAIFIILKTQFLLIHIKEYRSESQIEEFVADKTRQKGDEEVRFFHVSFAFHALLCFFTTVCVSASILSKILPSLFLLCFFAG